MFKKLFSKKHTASIIGMVHVSALPGTPRYKGSIEAIISTACKETEIYLKNNVDAICVENMHDIPYVQSRHLGPETTAMMTRICTEIRKLAPESIPCGLQILACGNKQAVAVAQATGFNFIRAEGYVFSHVADEGFTDADAGTLLRYRKSIGAENVLIFTDIKKKHSSHAITSDVTLLETAKAAEFFDSDGLILTGSATAVPADCGELEVLKKNCSLPIIIGSGVTRNNLKEYMQADALIIGSHFKDGGDWRNPVNNRTVSEFMEQVKRLAQGPY